MPLVSRSKRSRHIRAAILLIFAGTLAAILGAKWSMIHRFGSDVPYMDQWDAEADALVIAHAEGKPVMDCILSFHNQHRPVLTKALAYGLMELDGQWSPLLQMTVNAVIHAAAAGIILAFAWRSFRTPTFVLICLFSLLLFCSGYAWENTLQGFQSQFYFLLGSAALSLWLTLGNPALSARWWLGVVVGIVGLGSMGSGILAFVAAGAVLCFKGLVEKSWSFRQTLALASLAALSVAGFFSGADFTIYNSQKAASIAEFWAAFVSCLAWPGKPNVAFALLTALPAIVFLWTVWRRKKVDSVDAVILSINVWCWLQMLALAVTRGHGTPADSSRYLDVLAFALLGNAFALARLGKELKLQARVLLICLWTGFVVTKLSVLWMSAETMLRTSFSDARERERKICEDNARSDDPAFFIRHIGDLLPYPFGDRLAMLASHPAVWEVLPPSMRSPLRLAAGLESHGFEKRRCVTSAGTLPETVWTASEGKALFVSRPLESRFSVYRLLFKGSPSLSGAFLALRSDDGRENAINVRSVAGDRWQTAHLSVPAHAGKVRLVARTEAGQTLSFAEPVEMGLYSYAARWVCKGGQGLFYAGLVSFAAGLGWLLAELRKKDRETAP